MTNNTPESTAKSIGLDACKVDTTTEAILTYMQRHDYVSFPELMRGVKKMLPLLETEGTHGIMLESVNVTLWEGMSRQFVDAILTLVRDGLLFFHSSSPLVYLIDGAALHLPLARKVPPNGYRELHWAPTCLRTKPTEFQKQQMRQSSNRRISR